MSPQISRIVSVKEDGRGGHSYQGNLFERAIYAILIHQWSTNITIKADKDTERSKKNGEI